MPQALRQNSTPSSSAAAPRKMRISRGSPPLGSKADQIAGYEESEETAALAGPLTGATHLGEPEHQSDLTELRVNAELIDLRRCSWCDESTQSLKAFNLPKFLLIPLHSVHYHVHETDPTEACPGCMRRILLKYLACQIITANILWPFLVLPIYAFYFVLTFRKGHSRGDPESRKG